MEVLRGASLMAATMSMGFVAAVFAFYSNTIMPGLRGTDDRTFVAAFRSIDEAITNPLFLGFGFLGALVLTGLAGALQLHAERRSSLPWIAAAFLLYLVAFVVTVAINVPLNNALKAAGAPDQIADVTTVRNQFEESTWVAWNNVRSTVSVVGFGCLAWALVQYGRSMHAESPRPRANGR